MRSIVYKTALLIEQMMNIWYDMAVLRGSYKVMDALDTYFVSVFLLTLVLYFRVFFMVYFEL